ncbi:hypothetical protein HX099_07130 [Thiopseudomonas alkaliphila]|uniref:Uncharacterized protein n=1 Tax=Thiopseudomonas alkaliphila TaxID=1697053 RepID=A0AAW7DS52_9GAMM|nr:hypothetical protein [Thiopseudomonas alkaliphila]MDM1696436.1 hypothetical protein [Thiopseudomonas alkaliphila]
MDSKKIKTIFAQVVTGVQIITGTFIDQLARTPADGIDQEHQLLVDAWNQVTTHERS